MLIMACMSSRRIRHLPVVDAGKVLGLISMGDVVKARMDELEGQSDTLRGYIEARRWHELYQEIGPAAYAEDQSL
jgi:signal-transduction protein with cAMP-binding, CBS, and nucleotidyltransferase domain